MLGEKNDYVHTSAPGNFQQDACFQETRYLLPRCQHAVWGIWCLCACAHSLWFGLNTKKHNMWLWSYSDVTAALLLILEECLWLAAASSTSLTSLSNKTQVISTAMGLYKPHCMVCQTNIDYSSNYSRLRAK